LGRRRHRFPRQRAVAFRTNPHIAEITDALRSYTKSKIAFWKEEFGLCSDNRPDSHRGSWSRLMTHEDSVQIEATSPESPRGRVRRCATAWERGLTVVSGKGRASVAGMSGSAFLPERKFSALQGLENSKNAEGILILCEPGPRAGAEEEGATRDRRCSRSGGSRSGTSVDDGQRWARSRSLIHGGGARRRRDRGGNFSASQSLENTQNGERISILREPAPGDSAWLTYGQRGAPVPRVNTGRSSLRATAKLSRLNRRCVAQVWIASLCSQ
jgi:hypothetical protein